MSQRDWLKQLPNPIYTRLARPFAVDVGGESFDCATDGAGLLLLPGATFARLTETPPLAHIVNPDRQMGFTIPLAKLRDWVRFCHGQAETTAQGQVVGSSIVRVHDALLNIYVLEKWLRPELDDGDVDVTGGHRLVPICFSGPSWRLYVSPMKTSELQSADGVVPFRAGFDLGREQPS